MTPPKSPPVPATADRPPGSEPENAPPEAESADRNPPHADPWEPMPVLRSDDGLWPIWVNDAMEAARTAAVLVLVMLVAWCGPDAPEPSPPQPAAADTVDTAPDADSAFAALVARVKTEEGFAPTAYPDNGGTWSIGYGFNSGGPFTDEQKRRWLRDGITEPEADTVLEAALRTIMGEWVDAWEPFADEPAAVEYALDDAAYQLGFTEILHFRRTLAAIAAGDPETAAAAIRDSRWHTETPNRAERLITVINGAFE